ncbi:hypothetical protein GCM10023207_08100 [Marivirga lumbricoides]
MILGQGTLAQEVQDKEKSWYLPDYAKLQYAGAIGFLSAGAGYSQFDGKMETELMLGFLPERIGGDNLTSLTLKSQFLPWTVNLKIDKYDLLPLYLGAYASYTFGDQFYVFTPERYPRWYYGWPTALRLGIFAGSRLRIHLPEMDIIKSVDFFYEVGSYDLKLASYIQNLEALSLLDVINIAAGIKIEF